MVKILKRFVYILLLCILFNNVYALKNIQDYNLAQKLYDDGLYNDAVNKLESIKESDIKIYKLLGLCYYKLNNFEKALNNFDNAYYINPEDDTINRYLALINYKKGKEDKSVSYLLKVINNNPQDVQAHYLLGKIYFSKQLYGLTIKEFRFVLDNTLKGDEKRYDALLLTAKSHYMLKNEETATKFFEQFLKEFKQGEQERLFLTQIYLEIQDYDAALRNITYYLELHPQDYLAYYYKGKAYKATGAYDRAEDALKKSIRFNPDYIPTYNELADVYVKLNKNKEAQDILNIILNKASKDPNTILLYAQITEKLSKEALALKYYEEYIKYISPDYDLYLKMANLAYKMNNYEKVKKYLERALAIKTSLPQAHMMLADIYFQDENYDIAKQYYENVLKYENNNAIAYKQIANIYFKKEKYNLAASNYKKALNIDVSDNKLNSALYNTYKKWADNLKNKKMYSEAIGIYKEALAINKTYKVLKDISFCNIEIQEYNKALSSLLDIKASFPTDKEIDYYLVKVYFNIKDYNKTIEYCDKIYNLYKDNNDFKYMYGYALLKTDKLEKSADVLKNILDRYEYLYKDFGAAYFYAGKYEDAIFYLKKAVIYQPDKQLYELLAEAYEKTNKEKNAYIAYKIIDEKFNDIAYTLKMAMIDYKNKNFNYAEKNFTKCINRGYKSQESYYYLCKIAIEKKEIKKALNLFENGLSIEKGNFSEKIKQLCYDYGVSLTKQHKNLLAVEFLRILSNKDPFYKETLLLLGENYYDLKEYDKLSAVLDVLLKFNDNNPRALYLASRVSFERKNYKNAIFHLTKANKINPDDYEILSELGLAYFYENNYKNAILWLGKIDSIKSNDEINYALLVSHTESGNFHKALYYYDKMKKKDKEQINFYAGKSYFYLKKYESALKLLSDYYQNSQKNKKQTCVFIGEIFQNYNKYDKALEYFKIAHNIDPGDDNIRLLLGLTYSKLGKLELAVEMLESVMNKKYKDKNVENTLSEIFLSLGINNYKLDKKEDALINFTKAVKHNPDNVLSYYWIGKIYYEKGRLDIAIDNWEKVNSKIVHKDTLKYLSEAYMKLSNYQKAVETLKKYAYSFPSEKNTYLNLGKIYLNMNNVEASIREFEKLKELDSKSFEAYYYLAKAYMIKGAEKSAYLNAIRGLQINNKDKDLLFIAAKTNIKMNNLKQAKIYIEKILKTEPFNEEANFLYGLINYQYSNYSVAEKYFLKVIQYSSNNVEANYYLGDIYLKEKNYDKAKVYFESVLKLSPQHIQANAALAEIYARGGEIETALRLYNKIKSIDPDFKGINSRLRLLQAKFIEQLYKAGFYDRVVLESKNILQKNIVNENAYYYLGLAYFNMKKIDDSIYALENLLKLNPDFKEVYPYLGQAYSRKGDFEKASFYFDKTLQNNIKNDDILRAAGIAYLKNKRTDDAIKALGLINNPTADDLFYIGISYYEKKNYKLAASYLQNSIKNQQDNYEAYYYLGLIYSNVNDLKNAENSFSKCLSINPKHAMSLYNIGFIRKTQKNYEEAINYFNKSVEIMPELAIAHFELSKIYLDKGFFGKAVEELELTKRFDPQTEGLSYYTGMAYMYISQNDRAIGQFLNSIEKGYEVSKSYAFLAKLYKDQGRKDEAIKAYREVVRFAPDSKEAAEAFVELSKLYIRQDKLVEASESLEKALKIDKGNVEAMYLIGKVYFKRGNYEAAEKMLKQVLKKQEYHLNSIFLLAQISEKLGKYNNAITYFKKVYELDPSYFQAAYKLGEIYYMNNKYSESIVYLRRALNTNPSYVEALYLLGRVYEKSGNYNQAVNYWTKVLSIDPKYKKGINIDLAQAYKKQKLYSSAIEQYQYALQQDNRNLWLLSEIASLYLQMNDKNTAVKYLNKIIEIDKYSEEALYSLKSLAKIYYEFNDLNQAAKYYKLLSEKQPEEIDFKIKLEEIYNKQGEYKASIEIINELIELGIESKKIYSDLTYAWIETGQTKKAIDFLKNYLRKYPKDSRLHYLTGLAYYKNNDPTIALAALKKATELDKKNFKAWTLMAKIYTQLKEYDKAKNLLEEILVLNPDDIKLREELIQFYISSNDYTHALEEYQKLLILDPNNAHYRNELAGLYLKEDNIKQAFNELMKVIEFTTDKTELARAYMNLSLIYDKKGLYTKAEEYINKSLKLYQNSYIYFNLGSILYHQKKYSDAAAAFLKALNYDRNNSDIYIYLGIIYYKMQDNNAAIDYLGKAVELDNTNPQAHFNLGVIYEQKGLDDRAEESYKAAIDNNPNFVKAYYNLGVLQHYRGKFKQAKYNLEKVLNLAPGTELAKMASEKLKQLKSLSFY